MIPRLLLLVTLVALLFVILRRGSEDDVARGDEATTPIAHQPFAPDVTQIHALRQRLGGGSPPPGEDHPTDAGNRPRT